MANKKFTKKEVTKAVSSMFSGMGAPWKTKVETTLSIDTAKPSDSIEFQGIKIIPNPHLNPTQVVVTKVPAIKGVEIEAVKEYHVAGDVKKMAFQQMFDDSILEDAESKANVESIIEGHLTHMIETEHLKSITHLVNEMALPPSTFGGTTPKDMIEAIFTGMRVELLQRINNETDVDMEAIMEEAAQLMLGLFIKHCNNVSVDKNIAKMKYRVMFDMEFDYGEIDKWL